MIPYTNSAHSSLSAYFITLLKCQSSRAQTWTSNLVWWMRWTFWPFATRNQIKFIVHKSSYVRGGTASRMTAGAITDMMSHIAVLHMWASKATWYVTMIHSSNNQPQTIPGLWISPARAGLGSLYSNRDLRMPRKHGRSKAPTTGKELKK